MSSATMPTEPHIRYEYDKTYFGGDYMYVGQFAYVPVGLVNQCGYEAAFASFVGIDACHIIHYSCDELFTADGEEMDDDDVLAWENMLKERGSLKKIAGQSRDDGDDNGVGL